MNRRALLFLALLVATVPSPAQDEPAILNQMERQWLDSLPGSLIVATETEYRPYNYIDAEGKFSGVAGDYLALIEEKLGVEFKVQAYATFAEVLEAARSREVDIVPLIVAAPERREYLDFSQPVYLTHDHIFTRQEFEGTATLDGLAGFKVGVVSGYAIQGILETEYPEIELVLARTEVEGLLALSLGNIDAFISEIGTSSYYIEQEAITNIRVAGEVPGEDAQTFATRNDWPILNSIIGKALANITAEEHAAIQRRWINIGGVDPHELERLWKQVLAVVAVIALAVVAVLIWNLSLRKLVARRTLELQGELAERRRVEAAKERLAVAVEQSAEYVLVIDTHGNIEYANLSFLGANGVKSLQGRRLPSLAIGDTRGVLVKALKEIGRHGVWRGRVDLERARKEPMKVAMTIAPIQDEQERLDGYVVTARDITNEEQLEARLRQREKLSALGTLANGIAHDFNNLLVPILGYTDLIRMQSDATVASYLDAITEASERARDLVQRILIFGRGGSGEKVPMDLRFEVEDAITFVRSLLPASIELQSELKKCGTVLGDRTQIQQILLNLCTNASDAMAEEGGELTIRVGRHTQKDGDEPPLAELTPGDYAVLTVSDTGVGMDEASMARVFDPYYTDKQQGKGTGLGLAIVHGIVRGHGGVIHVESAPGAGTRIRIYFPTVSAEPSRIGAESGLTIPRGNGERIMVIDDDKLVLSTVTVMVKGLGYEVSDWTDPAKALAAFAEAPGDYDAIITDLTMTGLSGIEFAKQALEIRDDLPIAMMTGNPGALDGYSIRSIQKPIPLAELANCLDEMT